VLFCKRDIHGSVHHDVKVKIKQSHYRPGQALRVPRGWGSQIPKQSAHEGGKVVSPTHRPPLPPGNIPGTLSVTGWVVPRAIVRPEDLCQWKKSSDTIGNRTRNFPACSAGPQPTALPAACPIMMYLTKMTKKMQLCRIIYCSLKLYMFRAILSLIIRSITTVFTASGIIHVCGCRLVSWPSSTAVRRYRALNHSYYFCYLDWYIAVYPVNSDTATTLHSKQALVTGGSKFTKLCVTVTTVFRTLKHCRQHFW
jgi:hypothetical protein